MKEKQQRWQQLNTIDGHECKIPQCQMYNIQNISVKRHK